jgi:glycosyltransferase involved in cell wall biosynthesis
MIELSIVMPCLNEAETLESCIVKAKQSLERLQLSAEIVVADNGSTDDSGHIAQRLGARVVQVAEKGYGNALRGGIEAAGGRWIIMADADDSYDFAAIDPFVEKLRAGYDLVMGCRLPKGGGQIEAGAMPWKHRWIGNPTLSFLGRFFFKSPVTDFHCGMRAFTKAAYEQLGLRTTGMEFASEMVVKASLNSLRVGEVPITLYKDGRSRRPHLRSWRDGWRHLRFLLLFCPTWLFLAPGLTLLFAGAAMGARLCWGPIIIGAVGFDTNTLLVCSLGVVVGLQITLFGVFTRTFAVAEGLLPRTPFWERLSEKVTLEKGLLLGLLIVANGLVYLINAVLFWKAAGFGAMSYPDSLRQVIPAVTLVTVGVQVIFFSFFLSILDLPRK